ncbi:MAG: branched-chain amino acid aminotransferase [Zetaproteobacteria bacterium]|nr:branched-chain amino acid aminotransferase [Zetaproteobacteria bacterium]
MAPSTPTIPGQAALDWSNLGFAYRPTRGIVRYTWKKGHWDQGVWQTDPTLQLHLGATALHYGQSCFEGLKAFAGADNQVRIFRPRCNAQRLAQSAERLCMPVVPESMFLEACAWAVRENLAFVPPYGSGASFYLRPLLIGSGATIGVAPSDEYTFVVLGIPVGDYYQGGLRPVTAVVTEHYDRAAPRGTGAIKTGANYAADLKPHTESLAQGYPINLYLDANQQGLIEEFGTSNFIALQGNTYLTPASPSILPSITNASLQTLAAHAGYTIRQRPLRIDEVATFDEVAACGTAVIITPVTRIVYKGETICIGPHPDQVPPQMQSLYQQLRHIQFRELPDSHQWMFAV